jgi:hypothetical protein
MGGVGGEGEGGNASDGCKGRAVWGGCGPPNGRGNVICCGVGLCACLCCVISNDSFSGVTVRPCFGCEPWKHNDCLKDACVVCDADSLDIDVAVLLLIIVSWCKIYSR